MPLVPSTVTDMWWVQAAAVLVFPEHVCIASCLLYDVLFAESHKMKELLGLEARSPEMGIHVQINNYDPQSRGDGLLELRVSSLCHYPR